MKKIKLMTVIVMAGIAGLTVRASSSAPTNLDLVTIQASVLVQGDNTGNDNTTKFNAVKLKFVTKDLLQLIANEFPTNAAAITNTGAKLAVDSFFDGIFEVLDKTNGVILADASVRSDLSNTNDSYNLFLNQNSDAVTTGSETETTEVDSSAAPAEIDFDSADDSTFFVLDGVATVKDSFKIGKNDNETDSEAFKFSSSGYGAVNDLSGDNAVVTTATVNGASKNNDNLESFSGDFPE